VGTLQPAIPSATRTSVRLADKAGLAAELDSGRSIEAIARELGRDPSTVAYWVNKHGLVSTHAAEHAGRSGIAREQLAPLVAAGLTVQSIAEELGRGATTVRYWLKKHGLSTARALPAAPDERPHRSPLPDARFRRTHPDVPGNALPVPALPNRRRLGAPAPSQAGARPGGRRCVPAMRLRPLRGAHCNSTTSILGRRRSRSPTGASRGRSSRRSPRRGVHSPVRQLPR
jgi:transposase-like protein